jgi:DNA-binding CsgD family transcriptional regulator
MAGGIEEGREAFEQHAWRDAYIHLSDASTRSSLEIEDLERLATAAYLTGRAGESVDLWARAHQESARKGEVERAARCAFWLAFGLLNRGELAAGGGWVDRAQRLLDEHGVDCVERGYLRYCLALRDIFQGEVETSLASFAEAAKIGERFTDRELTTLARIGEGRCRIFLGQIGTGVALLDEAMVAVGAREVSPIAVGDAYCTVIDGCRELFDIHRVQTWTGALSEWCDAQPQLVLYHGRCLVHRAEILALHGAWQAATEEVDRALTRLADPPEAGVLGAAWYLRAELHRVRGELEEAAQAYRQANEHGHEPQPGLALLRLAQGRTDAAAATIRRVLDEAQDPNSRTRMVGPFVEIVLAAGDVGAAASAANELAAFAAELDTPMLNAISASAAGSVSLAEGDAPHALTVLRRAWRQWRDLEAPYEAARARVLIAQACRALGDHDGADMELDAARSVFEDLGAAPDLARVSQLAGIVGQATSSGLTTREIEVLRLLATGMTNRAIASRLMISEKTVASHLSHIFTKLQLPSRAAATAFAYEHGLVSTRPQWTLEDRYELRSESDGPPS